MDWVALLPTAIGIVTVIVGSGLVAKSQAIKTSLENYKELSQSYERKTESLKENVIELESTLNEVKTELRIFKEIPLKDLRDGVNTLLKRQKKVIENTERATTLTEAMIKELKDCKKDLR